MRDHDLPLLRVDPDHSGPGSDLGFVQAIVVPPGRALVWVSGQLTGDASLTFAEQVDATMDRLVAVLEAAGATPADVVRITCLVVDADDADKRAAIVSAARRRTFAETRPTSTMHYVPRLAAPTAQFEVDAIAVVPTIRLGDHP